MNLNSLQTRHMKYIIQMYAVCNEESNIIFIIFYWQLSDLQSTSLGVLSKCVARGVARENLHQSFSLWNIVSVLHDGCRSGSTKSSSYRCTEWGCSKWGGDLQGSPPSLLMGQRFSVVRGPQARCDAVFCLSPRYYGCVRLGRWRGCASCHYNWWPLAEFRP